MTTALTPKQRTEKFMNSVMSRKDSLQSLMPEHVDGTWFLAEVRLAIARSPGLMECDEVSVFDSITTCAQLGLSPSGRLGSAYLIPFAGKCTLVIGYKGYLDLAFRSGEVKGMQAQVVYQKDFFEWEEGLAPVLKHKRSEEDNPGALRAVYAVAEMKDGYKSFVVMTRREVEAIKARSPGARKKGSPWFSDEPEMWKKTAVRRLIKMLPLSPQKAQGLARAQEAEDAVFEEMPDLAQREEAGEASAPPASRMERLSQQLGAGAPPQRIEPPVDRRKKLTPEAMAEAKAEAERWAASHKDKVPVGGEEYVSPEPPDDVVLPTGR